MHKTRKQRIITHLCCKSSGKYTAENMSAETPDDGSSENHRQDTSSSASNTHSAAFQWRSRSVATEPDTSDESDSLPFDPSSIPQGNLSVRNVLDCLKKGESDSAFAFGGGVSQKARTASGSKNSHISTKEYHRQILRERGYDTDTISGIEWLYEPQRLLVDEKAIDDYNMDVTNSVVNDDIDRFERLLRAGKSPHAQNKFGHTLLHLASRKGSLRVVQKLVECGVSVNVADDCGKTPLHDVCWTSKPNLQIAKLLMNNDESLARVCDRLGAVPFEYVKKEQWGTWNEFLDEHKDVWWPPKNA